MRRIAVDLIEKMRRGERSIPARIKTYYKIKKFHKYAQVGEKLNVCARSNCSAQASGLIKIGNKCRIYGALQSMGEGTITIGDNTCIYERTVIGSVNSITIGNCVVISNQVHIYDNNNHPISPDVRHNMCLEGFEGDAWSWIHSKSAPIVIEDDVWIGENSTILKGVTIGRGSIIGCASVVTKDVPPYTIVAGNPARVVKEINHEEE